MLTLMGREGESKEVNVELFFVAFLENMNFMQKFGTKINIYYSYKPVKKENEIENIVKTTYQLHIKY